MKVSVIVPVYNAEKYIRQCIDSLMQQTLDDCEFIFVDDGSTDSSTVIIKNYQKEFDNILLLNQSNKYAGVARNNGLKYAKGKYVIFLDADDFFEKDMLASLYIIAENNYADIVVSNYNVYDEMTHVKRLNIEQDYIDGLFSYETIGNKIFQFTNSAPWNKFYRRSFLIDNKIEFQSILNTNDLSFVMLSLALAERIVCTKNSFVNYRVNNSNSLQGAFKERQLFLIEALSELKQQMIKRNIFEGVLKKAYYFEANGILSYYINKYISCGKLSNLYNYLKKNMIPNIFDNAEMMASDDLPCMLLDSVNCESFLSKIINSQRERISFYEENYVSMNSKTFRFGQAVLCVPSMIKNKVLNFNSHNSK